MEKSKCASLDTLVIKNPSPRGAVILLHGYGASMEDLAPLAQTLPAGPEYDWFFPNAPLALDNNPFLPSRAWFTFDIPPLLDDVQQQKVLLAFLEQKPPPDFFTSIQKLHHFINQIKKNYASITLGGFSQGGMMAAELAFSTKGSVHRLALFSTALLTPGQWPSKLKDPPPLKVFQSHGKSDLMLPLSSARKLKGLLEGAGISLQYHEFSGGHEIPPTILSHFNAFLTGETTP